MKEQFDAFIKWCKEKGYKPSKAESLLEYVAKHQQETK